MAIKLYLKMCLQGMLQAIPLAFISQEENVCVENEDSNNQVSNYKND